MDKRFHFVTHKFSYIDLGTFTKLYKCVLTYLFIMAEKNKSKYILVGIIIVLTILLIYSYSRPLISSGLDSVDIGNKQCLNYWEVLGDNTEEERFDVKVSLEEIKDYEGFNDGIYSQEFWSSHNGYFVCERERPKADLCFIKNVFVEGSYAERAWWPQFEEEQEMWIKSFTVGCVCYYNVKT